MGVITPVAGETGRMPTRARQLQFWLSRLYWTLGALIVLGLAANFTSTVFLSLAKGYDNPYSDFIGHVQFCVLGLGAFYIVNWIFTNFAPTRRWLRVAIPIAFFITLILVAMVRFSPWGITEGGARRWLDIGPLTFQPSELLKVALVLYLAQLLCWWRKVPECQSIPVGDKKAEVLARIGARQSAGGANGPWWKLSLARSQRPVYPEMPKRCMLMILVSSGLTAIQPDLGTTGVILGAAVVTLVLAGVRARDLLMLGAIYLGLGLTVVAIAPDFFNYAEKRVQTWLNPTADDNDTGYQITQSRGAIAVAGLAGRGYLKSEQKINRMPLSTKDFIYPVMVEELGYIGGVGIILLFIYLGWVGTRLALYCRDPFAQTAIAALGYAIALQALVNIGTTTGTLPLSGITLPFLSDGGTSIVVSIGTIAIMAALARGELAQLQLAHAAVPEQPGMRTTHA
jgi:cell division protein FtsW